MSVPIPRDHGGDGAALAAALGVDVSGILDLSASLNPVAPDAGEIVAKHLDAIHRYPDPLRATEALAHAVGVATGSLLLTNGGAEAIALVAAELGGSVVEPDFSLYPRRGGPLWRSNPHNPSGRLAAAGERAGVWDEAFYPLATGHWTRGDARTGAVVVGSLTKLLACPGLRVGYVLSDDPDLVARLRRRQPAWSLNGLAAAAVPHLLERCDLPAWALAIRCLRADLTDLLAAHGMPPHPSDANYVIVRAPGLRDRLARRGILVRDCASFGLDGHARIAVPSPDGLARLASALDAL